MTRKLSRNYSLSVAVAASVAILVLLIAAAVRAQTSGAGQTAGQANTVLAPAGAVAPAQAERPLTPWTDGAGRLPVGRSQTKHGAGAIGEEYPFSLAPAVTYDSDGSATMSLAVADLRGDGKPDVVVADDSSNSVGVLLGNGDGTFQPAVSYGVDANPISIIVGDFNGDGKPDVVVANQGGNTVSVLLGNGDGTFQPAVSYEAGPYPTWVAMGDFNLDGKLDLVVAIQGNNFNCYASYVSVLLGNGDGTFQAPVEYGTGGACPGSVAVSDVNGDGKPDLVVANFCETYGNCPYGTAGVLLGNGDGTFQAAVSYALLYAEVSDDDYVAVGDLNGDGKPDIVVGLVGGVDVLMGNGDGTFQTSVFYSSGAPVASDVVIADVNGDGKPDLLMANFYGGSVDVLLGNGDGTFQPPLSFNSGYVYSYALAVADVNGDGQLDVVVTNTYGGVNNDGSVGVLLNNSGAPGTTTTLVSSLNPAALKKVVTYTAAVTAQNGGPLTGTVTFQDGGSTIATVPLANNQAAYSTTYKKGGSHAITATYPGNLQNRGSTSATLTEYIESVVTKTVVTTSGSPSHVGQPVTFTATVTSKHGAIPDGELVTFYDGKTAIGTGATASGVATFTTSSLKAKTHTIKAIYPGDAAFEPSTGTVQQAVDKYPTTTALSSSLNPSNSGQAVTFTAVVTSAGPETPTGKVEFKDGTKSIGSATLSAGVATLTTSKLAVGTHPITAEYMGDADSAKSTSSILDQVVQ